VRWRHLLGAAALSTAALAGCQGERGDTVTPDLDDPLPFVVTNDQGAAATVQLMLAPNDGATVLDESVILDASVPGVRPRYHTAGSASAGTPASSATTRRPNCSMKSASSSPT